MKGLYLLFIALYLFSLSSYSQTFKPFDVLGFQISGCNANREGELIFLYTKCGFAVDSLEIGLDSIFNTYSDRNDYFINKKGELCGWKEGDLSVFEECDNLISAGPGDIIPPRSMVIIQMTADAATISSLKGECDLGIPIYVISNDCIRYDEAFPINGVRDDTFRIEITLLPDYTFERFSAIVYSSDPSVFDLPLYLNAEYPGTWGGFSSCDTHTIINFRQHIAALYPQFSVKQPSCDQGGSIEFPMVASNYSIDGGQTWQAEPAFENLTAGSYLPAVWDDFSNCPVVWLDSVVFQEYLAPEFLTIWWQPLPDTTCQGALAKLYIDFRLGMAPVDTNLYEFSIDSGQTFQDSWIFTNVKDGNHHLAIREKANPQCITHHHWVSPPLPQVPEILGLTDDTLSTCKKGLVGIQATGNNLLYSLDGINYSTDSLVRLVGGQPTVIYVKEAGNDLCIDSMEVILTEVAEFIPEVLVNGQSAEAFLLVESKGPYGLRWSTGDTTWQVENLPVGLNALEITDGWGCTTRYEFFVSESTCIFHLTDSIVDATCETPTTSIYLVSTDSINEYEFDWSIDAFDGLPYVENVPHGIFTVKVSYGDCVKAIEYRTPIGGIQGLDIVTNPANCANPDGSFMIQKVIGGQGPFLYDLSRVLFENVLTVNGLNPGVHTFTITDARGCAYTDSVRIEMDTSAPKLIPLVTVSDCELSLYQVDLRTSKGGAAPYTLQLDGIDQAGLLLEDLSAGNYELELIDKAGCRSGIYDLDLHEIPRLTLLNQDTMILPGSPLEIKVLGNTEVLDTFFILNIPGSTICSCSDTVIQNANEGLYLFGFQSKYGDECQLNNLTFTVSYLDAQIYIPNSFSPNGDQVNDIFEVYAPNYEMVSLEIYNRWGGRVYLAKNPDYTWDGRQGNEQSGDTGVFVYRVQLKDNNGKIVQKTGTVTVIK